MQQADAIADYVAALSRELRFDPSLSRRVGAEVEDHLREAAADGTGVDVEGEAIARFGSPSAIARQFAAPSLMRQAKGVGYAMVLVVLCSYLAMEGRLAWYTALNWRLDDNAPLAAVRSAAVSVDRYAFVLAAAAGLCGLAYAWRARLATELDGPSRGRLRCFLLLCAVATLALMITVSADIVLTALRLEGAALSLAAILPAMLLGVEIALAAFFIVHLRSVTRRVALALSLFPG
ncbi:MAG TPA: hypothetical protein VE397_07865 [Stellaceae bacterium]|nr:hypothetical protein [Stellaceae bacterium]